MLEDHCQNWEEQAQLVTAEGSHAVNKDEGQANSRRRPEEGINES
jgi:hypothetical protein